MIYMNDLLFNPQISARLGRNHHAADPGTAAGLHHDRGSQRISLALSTARANIPMVMARKEARITEGPAVSISYVSGSSKKIQTMSLPRKALPAKARVLVVDDFMRAGGTARGMQELAEEVGAEVVGTYLFIASRMPEKKIVTDYASLMTLRGVDDATKAIDIVPELLYEKQHRANAQ